MQNLALSTIFVTAVLSISLIFIFSRTMSKRVRLLNQGVKEISQGNWDFNIAVEGSDEIGELAENIENMAQDVKTYRRGLSLKFEGKRNQTPAFDQST